MYGIHCLLNVGPSAIERLHRLQIYPIVIFARHKSPKQIREIRDPQFLPDKMSNKTATQQFEKFQRIEQDYCHQFSGRKFSRNASTDKDSDRCRTTESYMGSLIDGVNVTCDGIYFHPYHRINEQEMECNTWNLHFHIHSTLPHMHYGVTPVFKEMWIVVKFYLGTNLKISDETYTLINVFP
ncbi:hypothetical protein KUTeg_003955 [Tegillarca granosa]|uniref:Guanylate kinase-like domain-containing protein n=1 Tax=Tegillarca granosa TaxID=220873 RepID=A0ABQ9FNL1_TEGGR|nr:hypothetical protein KUTeg_003955 [Tegillarca granosa]